MASIKKKAPYINPSLTLNINITNRPRFIYSERQKYGINSLEIKHIFFQKNLWTGQF
jgi:hypothetical protein